LPDLLSVEGLYNNHKNGPPVVDSTNRLCSQYSFNEILEYLFYLHLGWMLTTQNTLPSMFITRKASKLLT